MFDTITGLVDDADAAGTEDDFGVEVIEAAFTMSLCSPYTSTYWKTRHGRQFISPQAKITPTAFGTIPAARNIAITSWSASSRTPLSVRHRVGTETLRASLKPGIKVPLWNER